jgi:hypothetical protein
LASFTYVEPAARSAMNASQPRDGASDARTVPVCGGIPGRRLPLKAPNSSRTKRE